MALNLESVSKKLDGKLILREVSLEAAAGEIFGLLGANESGKTTLLRVIAGTEKADSGKILFEGGDLSGVREKVVFYPWNSEDASVWKNAFFKGILKMKDFSEYFRQKFAFEKALFEAQSILLLDQPFTFFEPVRRDEALEKLREAATAKNLTIVLATNDYEEAFAACDRIGVLHKGEIVQIGTPRELYEKPLNVAVAISLGRCNLVEARRISFSNGQNQEFQTLEGNHRLQTGKTEKNLLGAITDVLTLAIRPEHISISFGASFPEDNLLKAEIIAVQYLGATTRVRLSADELILEALVLRLVGLNIGDECLVGLPPDRILVLKN